MNTEQLNELLNQAKELLKGEMTTLSYNTWITHLKIDSIKENNIVLVSEDAFKREHIEKMYHDLIKNTFNFILGRNCSLEIIIDSEAAKPTYVETSTNFSNYNTSLNPKFSFENFIVGENNRFANAAAFAVAEAPATEEYNPLFIYGGVGLGKTHLMHAIGNEVLKNNKRMKILYTTCEKFTNAYINALQEKTLETFRQKFRTIDILLIDDIQFITGKERFQEELLNTFNELRDNGKQIVFSSDKPPRDIPLLEDRLKTRFEGGVLADISMVDYETRLAILRQKNNEKKIIIDDDILANIAAKIDSSVRELEGVFNKVAAMGSLTHTPITIEMSEKAINDVILQKTSIISVDYVKESICKYFDITTNDLISSNRSNDVAFPRQVAMYLARVLTNESYNQLGDAFGKRDHSTVMHAFTKIEKEIKENEKTKLLVESVKKIILNKEH